MITMLIGQVVLGWLLADLLSGGFHWIQDNVLKESTPILGSYLAAHAKLHHSDPLAFTRNSFAYRNGATFVLAAVVGALTLTFGASLAFSSALTAGVALSTQAHYWAHCPRNAPKLVLTLQEMGVLQSPKQHSRHHQPPFRRAPCILSGFLNPIIDRFGAL